MVVELIVVTAVALAAVGALWCARRREVAAVADLASSDGVSVRIQCRPRTGTVQDLIRTALARVGLRESADGQWCRSSDEAVVAVAGPVLTDQAVLIDTTLAEVPALLQSLIEVLLAERFTIRRQAERRVVLRRRWQSVVLTVSPA